MKMSVESRMGEFEKVSDKENNQDVSKRMDEFEQVDRTQKKFSKDKFGILPYGMKKIRPCPNCGEIMEIEEIKEKEAIYYCKACNLTKSILIEK